MNVEDTALTIVLATMFLVAAMALFLARPLGPVPVPVAIEGPGGPGERSLDEPA